MALLIKAGEEELDLIYDFLMIFFMNLRNMRKLKKVWQ